MLTNQLIRKRSVVFTWFGSYILILLIPILISSLTYHETANIVRRQIEKSNMFVLKQVQQQMDNVIDSAERLSTELSFNSSITDEINNAGVNNTFMYNVYKINTQLKQYVLTDSMIKNLYIYFANQDIILTPVTSASSELFYSSSISSTNEKYEEWKSLLNKRYKGELVFLSRDNQNGRSYDNVLYARSFPLVDQKEVVNLFINLGSFDYQKDSVINDNLIYVLDSQNNIWNLSQSKENNILPFNYSDLKGKEGVFFSKIGGKSVAVSYVNSSMNSWKYISIMPSSSYWNQAEYIRNLTIVSALFCIIVGLIVSYFFMKRNYRPLKELINSFRKQTDIINKKSANEFYYLQDAIKNIVDDKQKIKDMLLEQNKGLRSVFLARLLKGYERKNVTFDDLMKTYEIQFDDENFAVAVFYIKDMNDFAEMFNDIEPYECIKLLRSIITNVVEELAGQKNKGYVFEVDELSTCLFNIKEENINEWHTEILRVVNTAKDFIMEHYKVEIMVGVSNLHENIMGIPEAYSEAVEVIDYNRITGYYGIRDYMEIDSKHKTKYYYPLEVENQLINYIKIGNFEEVKAILEKLYITNFKEKILSLQVLKCLMFDMSSTMIKTVDEISSARGSSFPEEMDLFNSLLGCNNINEMKEKMLDIAFKVCEFFQRTNEKSNFNLRDKVIEYVINNYKDINLSNSTIAKYLDMNPNYVSSTFKLQYGKGLADFINIVRISKAKELMKDKEINVEELAVSVGYFNVRTFTRCFKKYEGMTPGMYKKEKTSIG